MRCHKETGSGGGQGMNECLLSLRVAKFEFSGTASTTSLDNKFVSSTSSLHLSDANNNNYPNSSTMSITQNSYNAYDTHTSNN